MEALSIAVYSVLCFFSYKSDNFILLLAGDATSTLTLVLFT